MWLADTKSVSGEKNRDLPKIYAFRAISQYLARVLCWSEPWLGASQIQFWDVLNLVVSTFFFLWIMMVIIRDKYVFDNSRQNNWWYDVSTNSAWPAGSYIAPVSIRATRTTNEKCEHCSRRSRKSSLKKWSCLPSLLLSSSSPSWLQVR